MRKNLVMRWIALAVCVCLIVACSSPRVRCDGRLRPINEPAKADAAVQAQESSP